MGTYFEGLGEPYGGCGIPQSNLETQYFVALNTHDTPGDGTDYSDLSTGIVPDDKKGLFDNGKNCGRWIKVTIGPDCNGINDGALGEDFCRGANAQWVDDKYSGAELYMIVADACPDANAWCRDSYNHLDMSEISLPQFEKNGVKAGDEVFDSFNNRTLYWDFVKAPDYSGDINVFMQIDAQIWWPAIAVNNLENGVSAIEQYVNGSWVPIAMNGSMGQSYILEGDGASEWTIRVYDADGELINNGRQYSISFPDACKTTGKCSGITQAEYSIFDPNPPKKEYHESVKVMRSEFEQAGDTMTVLPVTSAQALTLTQNSSANNYKLQDSAVIINTSVDDQPGTVTTHEVVVEAEDDTSITYYTVIITDELDYQISRLRTKTIVEATAFPFEQNGFIASLSGGKGIVPATDFRIAIAVADNFPEGTVVLWDIAPQVADLANDLCVSIMIDSASSDSKLPVSRELLRNYSANIYARTLFGRESYYLEHTSQFSGKDQNKSVFNHILQLPEDFLYFPALLADTTLDNNGYVFTQDVSENIYSTAALNPLRPGTEFELTSFYASAENKFSANMGDVLYGTCFQLLPQEGIAGVLLYNISFDFTIANSFTYELSKGWNLISIPLVPDSSQVEQLFPNASKVKDQNGFYSAGQISFLNGITNIEGGKAYLLENNIAEEVEIIGLPLDNNYLQLKQGWNLISGPSDSVRTVQKIDSYQEFLIKDFNNWNNEADGGQLKLTIPGRGYFYYSNRDTLLQW